MQGVPFSDHHKEEGSQSDKTIYLSKVPVNKFLEVKVLAAHVYTTNLGDYATQKYIVVGYEHNGNFYVLSAHDLASDSGVEHSVVKAKSFIIPEGARPFAYFEGTSSSETYILSCSGLMHDLPKPRTKEAGG